VAVSPASRVSSSRSAGSAPVGGSRGQGGGDVGGAALVVQRQRHQLQVGQDGGQRAQRVHQQRAGRQAGVQQARGLHRLVHGGVDAAGQQLDARVPGQAGGTLQVVVLGVEGGAGGADEGDGQRGVRRGLRAGVPVDGDVGGRAGGVVQVQRAVLLRAAVDERVAQQRVAGQPQSAHEQLGAQRVGPGAGQRGQRGGGPVGGGRLAVDLAQQGLGGVELPTGQC
jgi:hypothetical protein